MAIGIVLAALGVFATVGRRGPQAEYAPAPVGVEAGLTDEAQGEPVALVGAAPSEEELRAAVKGANVIICVLDEARTDHFGCYGYAR